jgi:hypothetical protein
MGTNGPSVGCRRKGSPTKPWTTASCRAPNRRNCKTNRYFVTPYGWKVARLFSRLEARVFRPAMAMFTANDAFLPFPLRPVLDRVDAQLDLEQPKFSRGRALHE